MITAGLFAKGRKTAGPLLPVPIESVKTPESEPALEALYDVVLQNPSLFGRVIHLHRSGILPLECMEMASTSAFVYHK